MHTMQLRSHQSFPYLCALLCDYVLFYNSINVTPVGYPSICLHVSIFTKLIVLYHQLDHLEAVKVFLNYYCVNTLVR